MKLTDARVVSNELSEGLEALQRIAVEASDDMASEWAQAVLTELGRLQAMEQRAEEARGGNAQLHDDEERGWLKASRFIHRGDQ